MATFITALSWGLGVGGGFFASAFVFAVALEGFRWVTGIQESVQHDNATSLRALERRNVLTIETISAVVRMADSLEQIANLSKPPQG